MWHAESIPYLPLTDEFILNRKHPRPQLYTQVP